MDSANPFNPIEPPGGSTNPVIRTIRRFNRFYTNVLGLLDQHMLDSKFSLAEVRVLYEIGHQEDCTSKKLIEELSLDPGYLSRMIKQFEKLGLTWRKQSEEDGRLYYLYLTAEGKETLAKLDERSSLQIGQMIGSLQESQQNRLVEGMETIERLLSGRQAGEEPVSIRCELRPGDIGMLIHLHGWIYARECGYNHVFEGYVCKTFQEFFEQYSPGKDRLWFAEAGDKMVGAIAIVGHTAPKAQLRWFILHPAYRGRGLGKTLMKEALDYCREKGYRTVFLETTEDQKTAIRMYLKAGFQKTAEHANHTWGVRHVEQTYELNLTEPTIDLKRGGRKHAG